MKRLLKLCSDFIKTDSTSRTGTVPLARLVRGELKRLAFSVTFQRARLCGAPQVNLIARLGPARGKGLLINTHLDTVATTAREWTVTSGDPFKATLKGGQLYGLGAADTKLALACQIRALESIKLDRLKIPLMITGTYGEEMGLVGIQKLIRHKAIKPRFVLNSEPTELKPSHGNFGFRIYRMMAHSRESTQLSGYRHSLAFTGKAAHSAIPHLGLNAIEQAIAWLRSEAPDLLIVEMKGGLAANIVAPDCSLVVLSQRKRLSALRPFRGRLIHSEKVSSYRVYPQLTTILRGLPASLVNTRSAHETTNLGTMDLKNERYALVFSQRFSPTCLPDHALARWQHHCEELSDKKVSLKILLERDNPALKQNGKSPFIRQIQGILRSLNRPSGLVLRPGCNESQYFAALGSDVLTIGPGAAFGNIHAPNESICIKELKAAVEFYRKVILQLCF